MNAQSIAERKDVDPSAPLAIPLAKGATIEVKSVHGDIVVARARDEQVTVTMTPDPGAQARVEMLTHDRGVTLCVVHASPNPKRPNECLIGQRGRQTEGVRKETPRVAFRVEVPDGVHFRGQTEFGNITTDVGMSNLDLLSANGKLSIKESGARVVQASTLGSGSIDIVLSTVDARPERRIVRLDVTMGDLTVAVPTTLPVRYTIRPDMTVRTPFKLELKNPFRSGVLGPAGEPAIDLTMNKAMLMGRLSLQPAPKKRGGAASGASSRHGRGPRIGMATVESPLSAKNGGSPDVMTLSSGA